LFDLPRFVRGIEAAFLEMQQRALNGRAVEAFRVPPQSTLSS
jgi:hypothetical protein